MLKRPLIRFILLLALSAGGWSACIAQSTSTLKFTGDTWDFGKIKEADGPVTHTFEFTNTGDNAIVIERVSTSCGCTTPSYSKDAILPGRKGEVKVTYDPEMRPGRFSKEVYIISNNGKNNNKLTIKGDVEAKPRTVEQDYPYQLGDGLRFNSLSVNFRYVAQGTPTKTTLGYANSSGKPLKAEFEVIPNDGIISIVSPGEICRDCKGELSITANIPRGGVYGKMEHRIIPVVNGEKIYPGISVVTIATDDFSRMDADRAPEARFSAAYYNFGSVKKGEKPEHTFTLLNGGKSDLIIRKVDVQEGFSIELGEGTRIPAGRSIKVKCTLDTSAARGGTFTKTASIITNDPSRPMRELRLAASVDAN